MSQRSHFFKSKATEKTMKWLETNYELCDGVCLPRCLLYSHYLEFCKSCEMSPISAAAFGKIIRRRFSKITTRRLGTRGQSKYHYFGLAIKSTSSYYQEYGQRYRHLKTKSDRAISRRSRHRCEPKSMNIARKILSDFPKLDSFPGMAMISADLENFLYKYKNHCDELVSAIIHGKLDDIPALLHRFWMLDLHHIISDVDLLHSDFFAQVIEYCDYLFYEASLSALISRNVRDITASCMESMQILGNEFENWLRTCLIEMPSNLFNRKIKASEMFTRLLKRYYSLLPLLKNCASLLNQWELLTVMVNDFNSLDLDLAMDDLPLKTTFKETQYLRRSFIDLLLSLDHYTDLDRFFATLSSNLRLFIASYHSSCMVSKSTRFILIVNRLIVCLARELTLNSATTLSHWITVLSTIREYSLLVAEDTIRRDVLEISKMALMRPANFDGEFSSDLNVELNGLQNCMYSY